MLNAMKDKIYAVRGNCEAEVDQMVLEFPVMADYCILSIDGKTLYATHGHVYNQNNLPPLCEGDILIHGHTHVLKAEQMEDTSFESGFRIHSERRKSAYICCSGRQNIYD